MRWRAPWLPACLATVLGGLVLWSATDGLRALTSEAARRIRVAEQPRAVPDVSLQAMDGSWIPLRPQRGEVVLVEFIFTTCPVICQEAAADFAALRDDLVNSGSDVRMISISFDPLRDTPEAMRDYGQAHGADGQVWTVARPRPDQLALLLESFGVTVIADEWGGFAHNAAIHLVNPQGQFSAVFDTDAIATAAHAVTALSWEVGPSGVEGSSGLIRS